MEKGTSKIQWRSSGWINVRDWRHESKKYEASVFWTVPVFLTCRMHAGRELGREMTVRNVCLLAVAFHRGKGQTYASLDSGGFIDLWRLAWVQEEVCLRNMDVRVSHVCIFVIFFSKMCSSLFCHADIISTIRNVSPSFFFYVRRQGRILHSSHMNLNGVSFKILV